MLGTNGFQLRNLFLYWIGFTERDAFFIRQRNDRSEKDENEKKADEADVEVESNIKEPATNDEYPEMYEIIFDDEEPKQPRDVQGSSWTTYNNTRWWTRDTVDE